LKLTLTAKHCPSPQSVFKTSRRQLENSLKSIFIKAERSG